MMYQSVKKSISIIIDNPVLTMSFVIIIFMLIFTFMTAAEFYKISKMSAALIAPYILWIAFAAYLNYGMMYLNTGL